MRIAQGRLEVATAGQGFYELTSQAAAWVAEQGVGTGLLTLFIRHTSASLLIQENAAPAARLDLEAYIAQIAPESAAYEHDDEGADDMPAHLRSALTGTQLSIPVSDGRPRLGRWQGIFLFEHRHHTPEREIALHLIGE